jgi:hypothetical protein
MIATPVRRKCADEIRRALKDCSPTTIDMLHQLIKPQIPKKNLRQALGILRRKGEVDMLVGSHQTFYYQFSQALPVRKKLAKDLNCDPNDLIQPLLRRQDWFHNQWCQLWSGIIKQAFPDVQIIREHDIGSNEIAREVLLVNERDIDLLPDFLVMFPQTEKSEAVSIAFEIERTRKSDKRILRKFRKYLNETKIDGLIYICDSGRLSETIRMLYQEKLLANAYRVKHYGDHFFLFSDSMSAGSQPLNRFFNAKAEAVSLDHWCNRLLATKRNLRRDAQFK